MPPSTIAQLRAAFGATRTRRQITAGLVAAAAALLAAAPAAGAAETALTGGAAYSDPDAPTVTVDGSSIAAPTTSLAGAPVRVTGRLAGTLPGDLVVLQRLDAQGGWSTAASATVAADGTYTALWARPTAGSATVRVVPAPPAPAPPVAAATTAATAATPLAPVRQIAIFRPARSTWYGPGFYGRRTACGLRLTRRLLGVAHRTLPCGTAVTVLYRGRTLTVPVVDRGPFRRDVTWDLTAAAAQAIGVRTTVTLGTLVPPRRSVAVAPAAG